LVAASLLPKLLHLLKSPLLKLLQAKHLLAKLLLLKLVPPPVALVQKYQKVAKSPRKKADSHQSADHQVSHRPPA
jgi:hypothetical protein